MNIGSGKKNAAGQIEIAGRFAFAGSTFLLVLEKNAGKTAEGQPDYRALVNGIECGALWIKTSKAGVIYMGGELHDPLFPGGRLYVAVFGATEENRKGEYDLVWSPPDRERAAPVAREGGDF